MLLPSIPALKEINDKFENGTSNLSKDSFTFITQIGSGAFGKVYKVSSKLTNKIYALKVLSKNQLNHLKLTEQIKNEINIFAKCYHENIVALYAAFEDPNYIYMIMELANDSNLFNKLKKQKQFSEKVTFEYLRDIVQAFVYLHSQNPVILHRDLKPENILIHDGRCKLSDFGWSNVNGDDDFRNTFCGTPDYLAPEMILGSGHTEKLDIWTVGILMYELLHGKPPFSPKEKVADGRMMQKMIEKNILKGEIEFSDSISPEAVECIKSLLNSEASLRPAAKEILELPFFRKYSQQGKPDMKAFDTNKISISSNSIDDMNEKALRKLATEYKSRLEILAQANKKLTGQVEQMDTSLKSTKKELDLEKAKNKKLTDDLMLLKSIDATSSKNPDTNDLKSLKLLLAQEKEAVKYMLKRNLHFSTVIDEFFDDFIVEKEAPQKSVSYENSLIKLQAIFRDFVRYKNFMDGKNLYNPYTPSIGKQSSDQTDPRKNRTDMRNYSPFIGTSQIGNSNIAKFDKEIVDLFANLEKYFKK